MPDRLWLAFLLKRFQALWYGFLHVSGTHQTGLMRLKIMERSRWGGNILMVSRDIWFLFTFGQLPLPRDKQFKVDIERNLTETPESK